MMSDNAFSSRMEDSSTPTMMMRLRACRSLMRDVADAADTRTMPGAAAVTSILTFTT